MAARRKHRSTGKKPPGGAREGAGRPAGVSAPLAYGEVKALKTMRWGVPEGTPDEVADMAAESVGHMLDVMRGLKHPALAHTSLAAATRVRELVCGPVAQKVKLSGDAEAPLTIEIRKYTTEGVPCQVTTTEESPQPQPPAPPEE